MAQVEAEIKMEQNLDETEFQKFETGELDLPSDEESDVEMSDVEASDEDLDEYYREIGVDPAEMKSTPAKSAKAKDDKDQAVYQTKEKKNKRADVIDKMLNTVRSTPNYKVINRVI